MDTALGFELLDGGVTTDSSVDETAGEGGLSERQITKILCTVIALVVITFFTALPIVMSGWFYKRGERGLMALRVARCFGGGAFLGAFLLHVTPEVIHLLSSTAVSGEAYPYPTLFIGGGFFMMMIAEKAVHMCTQSHGEGHSHDQGHDNHAKDIQMSTITNQEERIQASTTSSYRKVDPDSVPVCAVTADELHRTIRARTLSDGKPPEYLYDPKSAQSHGHSHAIPDHGGGFAKSVILLFALSMDCVFEGMALGLQSNSDGAWNMLIAILSHEFIIGFTLGLQLLRHNSKTQVLMLALFYGITCPLGIVIGTLIMEVFATADVSDIYGGVFQAITGGVFIYVTFYEILADEISSDTPLSCILSTMLGFAMMALLMIVHAHGHSHGGGHDHSHGGDDDHGHDDHGHSHDDHGAEDHTMSHVSEEAARELFRAVFRAPHN